ncbi:alpha/beta hydrolase [Paractinoplanes rishiriensis]|uniref:Thioesterase n=1 Tax=Paractinoplanes rishiriensis TaxID=1050105 RepID=A0A919MUV4_9ACTN|nr:alpha/beta hydrolase [Actinoplanes rishiriensis]GIE92975.1 thioesterase [Actinoplanes rishiriensis]
MTAAATTAPAVRPILLDVAGVPLSGLVGEPAEPPRGTILALHGSGMSAGYFHGPAGPGLSLLTLGVHLGFTVLALDRPGYRGSAARLPDGQSLQDQAATVAAAVHEFTADRPLGAGLLVVAHSFGGKLALALAAGGHLPQLLGLDISGCGHRYAVPDEDLPRPGAGGRRVASWGPLRCYPPDTFATSQRLLAPLPAREATDMARWPQLFHRLAPAVRVPVRITFAEHERWWRHDPEALAELRTALAAAPRVQVDRQPHAGHNISLGWAARAYHLKVLGFAEELIAAGEAG